MPVLEWALLRRILDKDPILQLLVTFAAFMILEDVQLLVWGGQPYFVSEVVNQLGTLAVAGGQGRDAHVELMQS